MKALKMLLQANGIDVATLQPLYEHGGERVFRLTVSPAASTTWAQVAAWRRNCWSTNDGSSGGIDEA